MATRRRNPKNRTKKNKRIRRRRGGGKCGDFGNGERCTLCGYRLVHEIDKYGVGHCVCSNKECRQQYS